jgi:sterol desaturase/sphingolipid hydroxylase (fatty acid hydroxylase superfamily)
MDPATLEQIQAVVTAITTAVLRPFFAFLRHDELLYWPYLLSAFAVSLVVFAYIRARHGSFMRDYLSAYFNRQVWWHPSARADYRYYIVNSILHPVLVAPLILSGGWLAGQIDGGLDSLFGTVAPAEQSIAANLLYTACFFIAYDFGRYVAHYLLHHVDVLWQFHKVHHSAEVLTPITSWRVHPVDLICMHTFPALMTGLVQGIFAYASGGTVGYYLFFGLHVGVFAYNLVAHLRHTHVWLSYGPLLSYLLISPAQHQIHHSVDRRHWGCNIGFGLAIWDWMFGTLYVPKGVETFDIGLGDGSDHRFHGVWRMYVEPFRQLARHLRGQTGNRGSSQPGG